MIRLRAVRWERHVGKEICVQSWVRKLEGQGLLG